ncbi:MAG: hypothetical protein E7J40_13170, partial [Escherichia coli]|nr:hypothetical protein [Escherichia coli]
ELLLCHGMVCVVGRIRDLILQLSKSSIYSTKPLSGYIANQVQTPEVIMGIRTSIALVPCGFMLLAFVIIWFYPLTDKKFKEIVVEIDNRKKVQQQLISDITN